MSWKNLLLFLSNHTKHNIVKHYKIIKKSYFKYKILIKKYGYSTKCLKNKYKFTEALKTLLTIELISFLYNYTVVT